MNEGIKVCTLKLTIYLPGNKYVEPQKMELWKMFFSFSLMGDVQVPSEVLSEYQFTLGPRILGSGLSN